MNNPSKVKTMWLSWHYQARTRNIAKSLNVPVYEYFRNDDLLSRHLLSSLWTIKVLITRRPDNILIQYSFMLLLIIAIYKLLRFNKVIIIVDCHTKALRRKAKGLLNYIFWPLKKLSFYYANVTIISNTGLVPDIKKLHDNFIILPDKIPEVKINLVKPYPFKYCVNISSFSVDEPFDEILELSEILKEDIKIFWTGKYPQKVNKIKSNYTNIEFTGYISFDEYYNLIANADCLLALTTEEDCLQSGAYEAISFEVPLVISNTKALRNYFQDAAIYTEHVPQSIAVAILQAMENASVIKTSMRELKKIRSKEFNSELNKISYLFKDGPK